MRLPEIPSEGGVALTLPAALQGSARLSVHFCTTQASLNKNKRKKQNTVRTCACGAASLCITLRAG